MRKECATSAGKLLVNFVLLRIVSKNFVFMITQENAKKIKPAYLNFLKCQPSWIKIDWK